VRFFIDACIAKKIARSLQAVSDGRETVVYHDDMFANGTKDVEWISKLREDGDDWIIISADPRIARNRLEQEAWRESGLTAFFLVAFSDRNFYDQAAELVGRFRKIVETAKSCSPGSGYLIKQNQKEFQLIYERPLGP
jgi:hypothetical protein